MFLRDGHRGRGVGPVLMEAALAEARALGLSQVQWQTARRSDATSCFSARRPSSGSRSSDATGIR
ncbi:GNAT family N-acetyltransferase [Streptomyces sp. NPDC050416]|uniref:GNAT family N-acetyltransferase n=1 Tax=Streptomyces sp. NPDC050416 TaxID=3365611 RepID=UPI0037888D99